MLLRLTSEFCALTYACIHAHTPHKDQIKTKKKPQVVKAIPMAINTGTEALHRV